MKKPTEKVKSAIKAMCKLWRDQIEGNYDADNGYNKTKKFISSVRRGMIVTKEQLDIFENTLFELILNEFDNPNTYIIMILSDMQYINIHIDYGITGVMLEAVKTAGFHQILVPIKSETTYDIPTSVLSYRFGYSKEYTDVVI